MMATAEDLLEELLEKQLELVRAKKGSEKEAALEARIAELESRFEEKPKEERDDAIEEITDEEYDLIRQHRAGAKPEPVVEPEPVADPPARKTRPGRKSGKVYLWTVDDNGTVQKTDIPHVYNGADEDDEVELPEETEAA
jgi:hypothetical protein